MEFAITVVIQCLDVKEEWRTLGMDDVCQEVFLLFTENVLGPHLNLDYDSVLSNCFCLGHFCSLHL